MFWRKKRRISADVVEMTKKGHELKEIVADVPREWLLELYWMLRHLQWPEKLCEKPSGWDQMSHADKYLILFEAIYYIEDRISFKERMRYERARKYDETEEQFNEYWESQFVETFHRYAPK